MKKYNGFLPLEMQISKITKPLSKNKQDHFATLHNIVKNWSDIVGKKYAIYCYPKKITANQFQKSTLFICAHNSAAAFALDANKNYIIEKIACYFGYKIINNIRITQELQEIKTQIKEEIILKSEDKEYINKITREIEDEQLKNTLRELGKCIFNKKTD